MPKKTSTRKVKVLNAICSFSMLASLVYVLIAGFSYVAMGVMVTAIAAVATPASIASDGILDALLGIVQAIIEGVVVAIEAVGSVISSLFSW